MFFYTTTERMSTSRILRSVHTLGASLDGTFFVGED